MSLRPRTAIKAAGRAARGGSNRVILCRGNPPGQEMKLPRRRFLRLAAAAAALPVAARVESAAPTPARRGGVIVPSPAGGQMDSIARVTERMRARLGQPMIIENVTGASGTLGVGRVARATADGYTLL